MLSVLFVLVALGEAGRFIQLNKMNAENITPDLIIDRNFARSLASKVNGEDIPGFDANFVRWMIYTLGIDVTAGTYDASTGGYIFSNGYALPATVIDTPQKIFMDTTHQQRGHANWFVSVREWYVGFNTTFTVTRGTNLGATIDPDSALSYSMSFFVKSGEYWGFDSVVRYTFFDLCTKPSTVCDGYETTVHIRHPDETAGVTTRFARTVSIEI